LYSRIAALPVQAEPLYRAILITALAVGRNMISLHRSARRLDCAGELDAALKHFSSGECPAMVAQLEAADRRLAALAGNPLPAMRARAQILAIRDALSDHRIYFEGGAVH
jgi:hypothetical protein